MQLFTCPAAYRRVVESAIALTLAEIGSDVSRRSDEDPRVQALAPVPDALLDPEATGLLLITVAVPNAGVLGDDSRVLPFTASR